MGANETRVAALSVTPEEVQRLGNVVESIRSRPGKLSSRGGKTWDRMVTLRLSADDYASLQKAACLAGMPMQRFVMLVTLDATHNFLSGCLPTEDGNGEVDPR